MFMKPLMTQNRKVGSVGRTGKLVQRVTSTVAAYSTHTTTIPLDDTIPQNTEGEELLTATITPKASTNILRVYAEVPFSINTGGSPGIMAIFRDSATDAISAKSVHTPLTNDTAILADTHEEAAGSMSSTTFKVRVGPVASNTLRVNGRTARLFGGVLKAVLIVEEIAP